MFAQHFEAQDASKICLYVFSECRTPEAFLSPLLFGIVNGSMVAILFQVVVSMSRFAGPGYVKIGRVPGTASYDELGPGSAACPIPKISITRPMGPRWFGNAAANTRAARAERRKQKQEILVAIADWRMVPFLDETALAHYKDSWSKVDVKVLVTNACGNVRRQIQESGLAEILQQPEETLADLHAAVLWAEEHVRQVEMSRTVIGLSERVGTTLED